MDITTLAKSWSQFNAKQFRPFSMKIKSLLSVAQKRGARPCQMQIAAICLHDEGVSLPLSSTTPARPWQREKQFSVKWWLRVIQVEKVTPNLSSSRRHKIQLNFFFICGNGGQHKCMTKMPFAKYVLLIYIFFNQTFFNACIRDPLS